MIALNRLLIERAAEITVFGSRIAKEYGKFCRNGRLWTEQLWLGCATQVKLLWMKQEVNAEYGLSIFGEVL